jgi:hypothetical protein
LTGEAHDLLTFLEVSVGIKMRRRPAVVLDVPRPKPPIPALEDKGGGQIKGCPKKHDR